MRSRVIAIALTITALGLVTAAPASAEHIVLVCVPNGNACERVTNAYQGSNYVYQVEVYDPNNFRLHAVYRLLFDGYPRYADESYGGATFTLDYHVRRGMCIQGGIPGLRNARTPCWYAP